MTTDALERGPVTQEGTAVRVRNGAGRSADPDARPAGTARARVVIGAVSLLSLVLGVLAVPVGADTLRWVALLVFVVLGVGSAPWQLNSAMRLPVRLGYTVITAGTVVVLLSVVMVDARVWHPALFASVVAVLCVPLHALGIRRGLADRVPSGAADGARPDDSPDDSPDDVDPDADGEAGPAATAPWPGWSGIAVSALGALLCLVAALTHRHLDPGFYGFLTEIGPLWYLGVVLLLVTLFLAVPHRGHLLGTPVSLIALVLTVTPALVYDGPRAQSTFKHVDLAVQIRDTEILNSAVDAYNAWPGLFSSSAWLSDVLGVGSILQMAVLWPPVLAVLRLIVLRFFFGQLLPRPWQAWVAVVLTVLADSIGADYFSPQSLGYVLGIGVFGLALSRGRSLPRFALLFLGGCALAVTHQLTPFIVAGTLVILALFRQVRPWWTPLLVLVPAGGWTLLHQGAVSNFLSLGFLGRLSNFAPPVTVASDGLDRLPVVGATTAAMVAGILLVGLLALVALIRDRRDLSAWAIACSPAVGLGLTAINPYGNEAIFRAALFGIPWLAALAARLFTPPRRLPGRLPLVATAAVLTVTFLVSSFGLDPATVTRRGDIAAIEYPETHNAGPYYLLYLGSGTMPTNTRDGHLLLGRTQVRVPVRQETDLDAEQQVADITAGYVRFIPPGMASRISLYALWSPAAAAYTRAYGLQSVDQFEQLRAAFEASPYWSVALQQDGTYLFQLNTVRYAATIGR